MHSIKWLKKHTLNTRLETKTGRQKANKQAGKKATTTKKTIRMWLSEITKLMTMQIVNGEMHLLHNDVNYYGLFIYDVR